MKIENKLIVVTGAGGGLGRELVLALLSKRATVIALDRDQAALDGTFKLAAGYKDKLYSYLVDLTQKLAVETIAAEIIKQHGSVDGLINNAGIIQPFVKVNDLGYDFIDRVFNVNFFGTLYTTKSLLPHLLSRPEAHIVNISSMGGFLAVPGQTIYCAAKAAVKLFTEGLNAELTDTNVRVTVVFPGAINTNIMANSGLEQPEQTNADPSSAKILSPADAAKQIIKGMEANKARLFVGPDSKLMNLIYRLNPKYASNLIYKNMKDRLMK